jgi:hypothetical protein
MPDPGSCCRGPTAQRHGALCAASAARSAIAADARAEAAGFGIGKKNAEMNAEITRAYFRLARRYIPIKEIGTAMS